MLLGLPISNGHPQQLVCLVSHCQMRGGRLQDQDHQITATVDRLTCQQTRRQEVLALEGVSVMALGAQQVAVDVQHTIIAFLKVRISICHKTNRPLHLLNLKETNPAMHHRRSTLPLFKFSHNKILRWL